MLKSISEKAKENPKIIYQYTNRKMKVKAGISELNKPGSDKIATTDDEKADVLNKFLSSVFTVEPDGPLP